MFRWSTRNKAAQAAPRNRVRLALEELESRFCPATAVMPQITSFTATILSNHMVALSGTVSDNNPASVKLNFSGVAGGSTTANANGQFFLQTTASQLGAIYVVAQDAQNQMFGNMAVLADSGATITGLTITQGGGRTVTVQGQVNAASPGGLTVTLSGVVSGTAITNASGQFTFTGTARSLGQISASVTDVWGVSGGAAGQLTNNAPVISNFTAVYTGANNYWTFEGQVTDENAAGLIVTLSGLASLNNVQVTVGADGWFTITEQLQPNETGMAAAVVTDAWGATSNTAEVFVA
jgi:hypothetical protein